MSLQLEEWKIREEIEEKVENDLEKEIKDGIYGLAMKLHNLYLHQREGHKKRKSRKKIRVFSEVNINIKMEGETTIEINESKKEDGGRCRFIPNPTPKQAHSGRGKNIPPSTRRAKFDWMQSLRSGSDHFSVNSRIEDKKWDKVSDNKGKIALKELGWKC
ncbi:hypothetical protein C2S52_021168 [Perilla frutescens var. hirtella]|nr:hypothetical protein C2S52_021168 [Perilla frutescens var. hirtella]